MRSPRNSSRPSGGPSDSVQTQLHGVYVLVWSDALLVALNFASHHRPVALNANFLIKPDAAAVLDPWRCGKRSSSLNLCSVSRRWTLIKVGKMPRNSKTDAMKLASPSLSPSLSSTLAQSKNPANPPAASSREYSLARTNAACVPSLPGL